MKNFIKATVLATMVATAAFGTGISKANASDPQRRNLETRRFYEARDAKAREDAMSMDAWTKMVVGGYGRPVGSRVVQPTTKAPTYVPAAPVRAYTPGVMSPAAAQALAITQSQAARDSHNRALMQKALANQSIRR